MTKSSEDYDVDSFGVLSKSICFIVLLFIWKTRLTISVHSGINYARAIWNLNL